MWMPKFVILCLFPSLIVSYCNLFYVRAAVSNRNTVHFNNNGCYIFNNLQQLSSAGIFNGKLYRLCVMCMKEIKACLLSVMKKY